jgi:hypothetical protein
MNTRMNVATQSVSKSDQNTDDISTWQRRCLFGSDGAASDSRRVTGIPSQRHHPHLHAPQQRGLRRTGNKHAQKHCLTPQNHAPTQPSSASRTPHSRYPPSLHHDYNFRQLDQPLHHHQARNRSSPSLMAETSTSSVTYATCISPKLARTWISACRMRMT